MTKHKKGSDQTVGLEDLDSQLLVIEKDLHQGRHSNIKLEGMDPKLKNYESEFLKMFRAAANKLNDLQNAIGAQGIRLKEDLKGKKAFIVSGAGKAHDYLSGKARNSVIGMGDWFITQGEKLRDLKKDFDTNYKSKVSGSAALQAMSFLVNIADKIGEALETLGKYLKSCVKQNVDVPKQAAPEVKRLTGAVHEAEHRTQQLLLLPTARPRPND